MPRPQDFLEEIPTLTFSIPETNDQGRYPLVETVPEILYQNGAGAEGGLCGEDSMLIAPSRSSFSAAKRRGVSQTSSVIRNNLLLPPSALVAQHMAEYLDEDPNVLLAERLGTYLDTQSPDRSKLALRNHVTPSTARAGIVYLDADFCVGEGVGSFVDPVYLDRVGAARTAGQVNKDAIVARQLGAFLDSSSPERTVKVRRTGSIPNVQLNREIEHNWQGRYNMAFANCHSPEMSIDSVHKSVSRRWASDAGSYRKPLLSPVNETEGCLPLVCQEDRSLAMLDTAQTSWSMTQSEAAWAITLLNTRSEAACTSSMSNTTRKSEGRKEKREAFSRKLLHSSASSATFSLMTMQSSPITKNNWSAWRRKCRNTSLRKPSQSAESRAARTLMALQSSPVTKITWPGRTKESPTKKKKKKGYSSAGFSRSLSGVSVNLECNKQFGRLLARHRVYNEMIGKYGEWIYEYELSPRASCTSACRTWALHRGGYVHFQPQLVRDCGALATEIEECCVLKQYAFRNFYNEPRIHALFSSRVQVGEEGIGPQWGYNYHGVEMKALSLSRLPGLSKVATELATSRGIDDWNIGLDVLVYRDPHDGISWHADDTQGETIVLCLVVFNADDNDPRTLCIQPKTSPKHGDEQVELFPISGDAYEMCQEMQKHYVHSILKAKGRTKNDDNQKKRIAVVFRHGIEKRIYDDSRHVATVSLEPPDRTVRYRFGHLKEIIEGNLYSRRELYRIGAHLADRKGISGNVDVGCDAIVVSRVDKDLGEWDNGTEICYHSTGRQGSKAMFTSFVKEKPVRVFRSSNGTTQYAPMASTKGTTMYRYDGIYHIIDVQYDPGTNGSRFVLKYGSRHAHGDIPIDQ